MTTPTEKTKKTKSMPLFDPTVAYDYSIKPARRNALEHAAAKKLAKAKMKQARERDEEAQTNKKQAMNQSLSRVDYIAILDFEATCDNVCNLKVQEVIEFPVVFVSTRTGLVDHIFHTYVRPVVHPHLTEFCIGLTGIEQTTVDRGILLADALQRLDEFLEKHRLVWALETLKSKVIDGEEEQCSTFLFATCGNWDLETCLPNQLKFLGIPCPPSLSAWCNIKEVFREFYGERKLKGMVSMLNKLELGLEGRHHSGIDDCRNLARIVRTMLQEGWDPLDSETALVTGTTLR